MRHSRGFTLLEMVVAIGIFAIIAAISYAALNNFLDAREQITERRTAIQGLQTAMVLLERDLRYAVNRPIRDQFGDPELAFYGGDEDAVSETGELLRLTTARATAGEAGAQSLQRVSWRLDSGKLTRVTWRVLDRYLDSVEYERVMLEDVEGVSFTFIGFDQNDEPRTEQLWVGETRLPAGVEVILRLEKRGSYRRVLQVAGL